MNVLEKLLLEYSELWNWEAVSSDELLTVNFIRENYHLDWDWHRLSSNKSLMNESFLEEFKNELTWGEYGVSLVIPVELIDRYNDWLCFGKEGLSANPNINSDIIRRYKDENWDFDELSSNPGIGSDFLKETLFKYPWNFSKLSSNPCFGEEHYNILEENDCPEILEIDMSKMYKKFSPAFLGTHQEIDEFEEDESELDKVMSNPNLYNSTKFNIVEDLKDLDKSYNTPLASVEFITENPYEEWNIHILLRRMPSEFFDEVDLQAALYEWYTDSKYGDYSAEKCNEKEYEDDDDDDDDDDYDDENLFELFGQVKSLFNK